MRLKRALNPRERKIRVRLAERGMTQMELCERVGCSKSYLTLIMEGKRSGTKYMAAICRELGIPYDDTMRKGA